MVCFSHVCLHVADGCMPHPLVPCTLLSWAVWGPRDVPQSAQTQTCPSPSSLPAGRVVYRVPCFCVPAGVLIADKGRGLEGAGSLSAVAQTKIELSCRLQSSTVIIM